MLRRQGAQIADFLIIDVHTVANQILWSIRKQMFLHYDMPGLSDVAAA